MVHTIFQIIILHRQNSKWLAHYKKYYIYKKLKLKPTNEL